MLGGIHFHDHGTDGEGAPGSPTPRQLPADVPGFVNRTRELDQLNAVLTGEDGSPLVVSVYVVAGTAGAGKTSLALRWAHQVRDRFPDGQLYINLRGYDPGRPVTGHEALHRFLPALGVRPGSIPQDLDAASALYRSLLADRRVLVVLDNAATVSQVRPLLPGSAGCLVVVTSRSRLSGLTVRNGARRLTLGTLPQAEAVALLRTITAGYRPADDLDKLTELADLCARLPLALRIAAERAASRPHMRLDDLIADLRDESGLWDALSTGDEEEEAVRTVFAWSYRALPEPAARLFRLLGLHPGPDFGPQAAAALAGLPLGRARQLLDFLAGVHLLEQPAPDRYQFHDLLRAYATDQAQDHESSASRDAALLRLLDWYARTADAAQDWLNPLEAHVPLTAAGDQPALSFPDYDSAMNWSEREHGNLPPAVHAAVAAGHDGPAWRSAIVFWWTRPSAAPVTAWLAMGDAALAAAGREGDRGGEAQLLTLMGMDHRQIHRLADSLECHRRALTIRRETGDGSGEAYSLNLIGLVHLRRRELDLAATHFEDALRLFRQQRSPRLSATAQANLAASHHHAGRLAEAADAAREALAAHRAIGNRSGEGNALRLLSGIEREQGDPERALSTARQALDLALGLRNHWLEGYWLLTLGDAQQAGEQYDEALVSYHRSATLHRRLGDRSREALAWSGTGEVYVHLDRAREAALFHRRAVAAHHELDDAWHEALALDGLATALAGTDPTEAHEHWRAALRLLTPYEDLRAHATRLRIEGRLGMLPG
ncbi:tetratricopeptide repeat protein [Streptomyces sp. NPDC006638]|uniref:ATP-binding protein n=1 Tax=Streptomyces sp. NPDC006638 TaxID=3157183 RepID=UPI0033BAFE7A